MITTKGLSFLKRYRYALLLAAVTTLYLFFTTKGITEEFINPSDLIGWNSGFAAALRAWIAQGSNIPYTSQWPLPELSAYENGFEMHHPHFYRFFSYHLFHWIPLSEFSIRLYGLSFFIGTGVTLYALVKKYWNPEAAVLTVFAFYMNLPNIIFGTSAHAGNANMFLSTVLVYLFLEYHTTKKPLFRVLSLFMCCLVLMTNWFFYFVPFTFALYELYQWWRAKQLKRQPYSRHFLYASVWCILPFVFLVSHFLYVSMVRSSVSPGEPSPFLELLRTIQNRSGLGQGTSFFEDWHPVTTLHRFVSSINVTFPKGVLLFIPAMVWSVVTKKLTWTPERLLVLLVTPICYFAFILFITSGTYETWAYNTFIAGAIGICFALGFQTVLSWLGPVKWRRLLLVLVTLTSIIYFISSHKDRAENELLQAYTLGPEPVEVGKYLGEITQPGDVIFEDEGGKCVFCWYTNQVSYFQTPVYIMTEFQPKRRVVYIDYIFSKLKPERHKFLVVRTKNIPTEINLDEFSQRGYQLTQLNELEGWRVYQLKHP